MGWQVPVSGTEVLCTEEVCVCVLYIFIFICFDYIPGAGKGVGAPTNRVYSLKCRNWNSISPVKAGKSEFFVTASRNAVSKPEVLGCSRSAPDAPDLGARYCENQCFATGPRARGRRRSGAVPFGGVCASVLRPLGACAARGWGRSRAAQIAN